MDRPSTTPDAAIRDRVEEILGDGKRCAECLIQVLRDEGAPVPERVAALAPFLEWGIGGSGSVCGVFMAALLAGFVQASSIDPGSTDDLEQKAPDNDWLDALAPISSTVNGSEPASTLAARLNNYAREQFGGFECHDITDAEWPASSPTLWGAYLSQGGAERCTQLIVEATRAYIDAFGPEDQ